MTDRTSCLLRKLAASVAALVACTLQATPAAAGCGCKKAPPFESDVRPNYTYAGAPVTLLDATFHVGQAYRVTFVSGTTSAKAIVDATAVERRDLSDGIVKPQLNVPLPSLPLGPTAIEVAGADGALLVAIPDADFTVVPQPVVLPEAGGTYRFTGYRAAVGRDHTVYLSLDLSSVRQGVSLFTTALGYPLRFDTLDVVIFNTQGFLMQLLGEPIPGLLASSSGSKSGMTMSDTLKYFRHEFETYFLRHEERSVHAVDPTDPNWHLDGTPHIDHNYLIIAIAGALDNGSLPAPGATPRFTLKIDELPEVVAQAGTLDGTSLLTTGTTTSRTTTR